MGLEFASDHEQSLLFRGFHVEAVACFLKVVHDVLGLTATEDSFTVFGNHADVQAELVARLPYTVGASTICSAHQVQVAPDAHLSLDYASGQLDILGLRAALQLLFVEEQVQRWVRALESVHGMATLYASEQPARI